MTLNSSKKRLFVKPLCGCGFHRRRELSGSSGHFYVNSVLRTDPTRTGLLQRKFVGEMNRRFGDLRRDITESVVENDCFGIDASRIAVFQPLTPKAFAFDRSADKVKKFLQWLDGEERKGVLEVKSGAERGNVGAEAWSNIYIDSAYQKGMRRARGELKKKGVDVSADDYAIRAAFNQPIHADRVGLIYTRSFTDLENITSAMDTQISRVLAQGLLEGKNPRQIASDINDRVNKIGLTRARTLARTEIVRAHHVGTINTYREAGVEGVRVLAEWSTAGFNVCPDCADLQGRVFTLDEIENLIPLHPNCRCVALPAGVGEEEREKYDESTIGKQYEKADGSTPKRGLYQRATGKRTPPPRTLPAERAKRKKEVKTRERSAPKKRPTESPVPGIAGKIPLCGPETLSCKLDLNAKKRTCLSGKDVDKARKALASYKPATRDKQIIAENNEKELSSIVKGNWIPDNEPYDVVVGTESNPKVLFELKTIVDGKNDKITMHKDALERKVSFAKKHPKAEVVTIVFDDRGPRTGTGPRQIYMKRGVGSFRLDKMEKVDPKELAKRIKALQVVKVK